MKKLPELKKKNTGSIAYLGIGTNEKNRKKNIREALSLLSNIKEIKILKVSGLLKNPPQEGVNGGYFLNGAIKIATSLAPSDLLKACKKIEKKMGRKINLSSKKRSRIIDLDILFYGNKIINTDNLIIPQPMIEKRYFVLIPLLEIAKNYKHPVLKKTIEQLISNKHNKLCKRCLNTLI